MSTRRELPGRDRKVDNGTRPYSPVEKTAQCGDSQRCIWDKWRRISAFFSWFLPVIPGDEPPNREESARLDFRRFHLVVPLKSSLRISSDRRIKTTSTASLRAVERNPGESDIARHGPERVAGAAAVALLRGYGCHTSRTPSVDASVRTAAMPTQSFTRIPDAFRKAGFRRQRRCSKPVFSGRVERAFRSFS
jgi:hypothetical protein